MTHDSSHESGTALVDESDVRGIDPGGECGKTLVAARVRGAHNLNGMTLQLDREGAQDDSENMRTRTCLGKFDG